MKEEGLPLHLPESGAGPPRAGALPAVAGKAEGRMVTLARGRGEHPTAFDLARADAGDADAGEALRCSTRSAAVTLGAKLGTRSRQRRLPGSSRAGCAEAQLGARHAQDEVGGVRLGLTGGRCREPRRPCLPPAGRRTRGDGGGPAMAEGGRVVFGATRDRSSPAADVRAGRDLRRDPGGLRVPRHPISDVDALEMIDAVKVRPS